VDSETTVQVKPTIMLLLKLTNKLIIIPRKMKDKYKHMSTKQSRQL